MLASAQASSAHGTDVPQSGPICITVDIRSALADALDEAAAMLEKTQAGSVTQHEIEDISQRLSDANEALPGGPQARNEAGGAQMLRPKPEESEKPAKQDKNDLPKTGDAALAGILAASLASAGALIRRPEAPPQVRTRRRTMTYPQGTQKTPAPAKPPGSFRSCANASRCASTCYGGARSRPRRWRSRRPRRRRPRRPACCRRSGKRSARTGLAGVAGLVGAAGVTGVAGVAGVTRAAIARRGGTGKAIDLREDIGASRLDLIGGAALEERLARSDGVPQRGDALNRCRPRCRWLRRERWRPSGRPRSRAGRAHRR